MAKGKRNATVVEFPETDHGIVRFDVAPDGALGNSRIFADKIGTGDYAEGVVQGALGLVDDVLGAAAQEDGDRLG